MTDQPEKEKLNPKVRDATIGIRAFRTIPIYPLAVGDEMEVSDIIDKALMEFFSLTSEEQPQPTDLEFGTFVVKQIKDNAARILSYATDFKTPEEVLALLKDVDNEQFIDIVEIIYQQNFEVASKKLIGFLKRAGETFGLRKPLPESASGTAIN